MAAPGRADASAMSRMRRSWLSLGSRGWLWRIQRSAILAVQPRSALVSAGALLLSVLAGPHPRSRSLGGFAPRSGRRRSSLLLLLLLPSIFFPLPFFRVRSAAAADRAHSGSSRGLSQPD